MLGSTHIILGAAVAEQTGSLPLGLTTAFVSHFVVDAIPHSDFEVPENENPKTYQYVLATLDSLTAFGLIIYLGLAYPHLDLTTLFWGGFFGLLPDLWFHVPLWKNWTRSITKSVYSFHYMIQHYWDEPPKVIGYGINVFLIGLSLWLLF
jgi:hypothetical protein